jgi:hypothetical protein
MSLLSLLRCWRACLGTDEPLSAVATLVASSDPAAKCLPRVPNGLQAEGSSSDWLQQSPHLHHVAVVRLTRGTRSSGVVTSPNSCLTASLPLQHLALDKPATEPVPGTVAGGDSPLPPGFNINRHESARHSKTFWAVEPPLPIAEPPRSQQLIRNSRFVPLCFDNGEACFRDVPTAELVRSISVFTVCGWTWLVKHADTLYAWSERLFGWTRVPSTVVRHSFFAHFCAGEDQDVRAHVYFAPLGALAFGGNRRC